MTQHDPFGTNPARRAPTGVRDLMANGLSVRVHMPAALTSKYDASGEEIEQGLPPSALRQAVNVDDCEHVPAGWVRSDGDSKVASYLVASQVGKGLWLDFNGNGGHTHHVAALISIQGLNAITGQRVTGQKLEQYKRNCPVHGTPFGPKLNCKSCGYNWPAQNYIATTGTPSGQFWLDGFRGDDGVVRQWYFTEDEKVGVAAQVIGEARSQAIGVSFYLSREPKPVVRHDDVPRSYGGAYSKGLTLGGGYEESFGGFERLRSAGPAISRSVEVAAGARVKQFVHPDPNALDFWQAETAATVRIYYATPEEARAIAGLLPPASRDGFMTGLKVGGGDIFSA